MRLPDKSMTANLTIIEEKAKEEIIYLERQIRRCNDIDDLFDLYCEADDIWIKHFEFYEVMANNDNFVPDHERLFLAQQDKLEKSPETVTINIFGCNVTMNVNK